MPKSYIIEDLMRKAELFSPQLCAEAERLAALSQSICGLYKREFFLPGAAFEPALKKDVELDVKTGGVKAHVKSSLPKDSYRYFYSAPLRIMDTVWFFLDCPFSFAARQEGDLDITVALEWRDAGRQKISSKLYPKRAVVRDVKIPPQAVYVRVALRIKGSGAASFEGIRFSEQNSIDQRPHLCGTPRAALSPKPVENANVSGGGCIPVSDLRIAAILDEFSAMSFGASCKVFPLTVTGFDEEIADARPHLLLVESAWHGSNGSWLYKIGKYARNDLSELREVIRLCRVMGVPTVFWNKEDPVHFESFIDAAKLFDYVYTTDERLIGQYRRHVGHDRVSTLMFAAQPREHNPMRGITRKPGSFFAGSYYANRHAQRRADMDVLFDAASAFPFAIYDRNYGTQSEEFMFPERFRGFIKGKLAYSDINKAYKGYQVALNVNSVADSRTMLSRRVFECLACGTPVVSTFSEGIMHNFPGIVPMARDVGGYKTILKLLTEDSECRERLSHTGAREVLQNHTYARRLKQICGDVGIGLAISEEPTSAIVCAAHKREDVFASLDVFTKQSYKNKRLWLFIYRFDGWTDIVNTLQSKDISVFFAEHTDNVNLDDADEALIAYIDPAIAWYGANYICDLVMAQRYSSADAVMKPQGGNQLTFAQMPVRPCSSLIRRQTINAETMGGLLTLLTSPGKLRIDGRVFCADRYNFSWGHADCGDV
ncbi:MAG: glycosyltransferase [Oscillospiraceae bacterium]|nr:glycosyltransferase [Oscillospiraceae bacterium]